MKDNIPEVRFGRLFGRDNQFLRQVGTSGWFNWLADPRSRSFRFVASTGATINVIKERRRGRGGQILTYWYCHKRGARGLKKFYLGKARKVTLAALERAALEIATEQQALPEVEAGPLVQGELF